jgi:pimeloyl-ACP methyl ester carboxylesterase
LETLGVDPRRERLGLLGHSDGGSIALLYAARFTEQVAATVVLAPHIMVEDVCLKGIARARKAYLESGLRQRLIRFHRDPDSAFWGWNNAWLDPAFSSWTIESELHAITCPLLAIQGLDDEYGTLEQIRGIPRRASQTQLVELPDCRHSPHRDQTQRVIEAIYHFFQHHSDQSTP